MRRTGNRTSGGEADHQIFGAGVAERALQLTHEAMIERACAMGQLLCENAARESYPAAAHGKLGVIGCANGLRWNIDRFDFSQARVNLHWEQRQIEYAEFAPLALRTNLIERLHQFARWADVFENRD